MATKAEYTIGTNAALPTAIKDIQGLVPSFAPQAIVEEYINYQKLAPIVADIVVAALDAVDASRAKES